MTCDIEYLYELIKNGVEESLHLEYKGAGSLKITDGKKAEISKDISAFANSDGGTIIYGVREFYEPEKKHLPEKIEAIERTEISKEWLEQVINNNIQPKVPNIEIIPISIEETKVVYVVNIPKGETAHQANDKRYYKRYNFISVPMEDYEIKDILNRSKTPVINIVFDIVIKGYKKYLLVKLENKSKVYAKYVKYFVIFPDGFILDNNFDNIMRLNNNGHPIVQYQGMNTAKDILENESTDDYIPKTKYGTSYFLPVLPESQNFNKLFQIVDSFIDENHVISWSAQADNGSINEGEVKVKDINIVNWDTL